MPAATMPTWHAWILLLSAGSIEMHTTSKRYGRIPTRTGGRVKSISRNTFVLAAYGS